jgi:hypothetical protein
MTYLIRVLSGERWNFEFEEPRMPFKANPLADLRTDYDNLSVFEFDDTKNNLKDILLGFASKRYGVSKLEYIKLDPSEISSLGFDIKDAKEDGNTLIPTANDAHKNIQIESAGKLLKLAEYIYSKVENIQIVKSKDIKELLKTSLKNGVCSGYV